MQISYGMFQLDNDKQFKLFLSNMAPFIDDYILKTFAELTTSSTHIFFRDFIQGLDQVAQTCGIPYKPWLQGRISWRSP